MYDGRVVIFQPGETRAIDGAVASLALEFNNTPLIEAGKGIDYTTMALPKLLKMAKEKGIKTRFGMKKTEVISLLVNG